MKEKYIRPEKIQTKKDVNFITGEDVSKIISVHKNYIPRYEMLQNYYDGYNVILDRQKRDVNKPNNRIASGYASYIVDLIQGMFVGKPITYSSSNDKYLEELQDVFNASDEQDENSELAKMAGINGVAYEIVYTDEEAEIRFNEINPNMICPIYSTTINPEMIGAIRYYEEGDIWGEDNSIVAEVYTDSQTIMFRQEGNGYTEIGREEHYFGEVPVIEYANNDEYIGDFERVISYINAYDKTISDTANDFEEFTDAFLILSGMMGTTAEDVLRLKEDGVILTGGEGKQSAEWLTKNINDVALENHKNRLNQDIHKFSKVPDMSDEQFSGNASGVALKHKLLAMEQVLAGKERKFKRGLQKRIRLITKILNKSAKSYDYTDIDISFTRNIPVNIKESVEVAGMLLGFTSTDTALAQLPMIDNIQTELEKIEREKGAYEIIDIDTLGNADYDDFSDDDSTLGL